MGTLLVAEVPPSLVDHAGLPHVVEPLAVQALVAELAVEALDVAVLPRSARRDKRGTNILGPPPSHHGPGREPGTVVAAKVLWLAVELHEPREREDHVLRSDPAADFDRQAFTRVLIEHAQQFDRGAVGQPIVHEVVGPDRVRGDGARQADVGAAATTPRPALR